MVKAIEFYQYHVCGPVLKGQRGIDSFRTGFFVPAILFWYGNLDAIVLWHEKVLAAFVEIDLPTTGLYAEEYSELRGFIWVACPTLIMVGLLQEASSLLTALGFCSDRASCRKAISEASFTDSALMSWIIGILIFLSSPPGTFNDAEVSAKIPSPSFYS